MRNPKTVEVIIKAPVLLERPWNPLGFEIRLYSVPPRFGLALVSPLHLVPTAGSGFGSFTEFPRAPVTQKVGCWDRLDMAGNLLFG